MTQRCKARTRSGEPCKSPPVSGAEVCRMHGGASPQVAARIERDRAEAEARQAVELFGGRLDIDPASALLELVQTKAAEVEFWRTRVHEIQQSEEDSLLFGVTKMKTGGEDRGATTEAKPHVALQLLHKAEAQLAEFCAAALRAGIDARMVEIAEATAAQFRAVIECVLADPRLGIHVDRTVRDAVVADALRASIDQ